MGTLKGQNLRVLVYDTTATKYKVVGMATNATITLTGNSNDASTKDDVGLAQKPEITSKSWSVQVESLDVSDMGAMLTAIKSLTPFTLIWDEVSTSDNQTPVASTAFARKGTAYLNDVTFTLNNRENSSKQLQFTGSGELETLAETPTIATVAAGSYTKGETVRLYLGSDNTTTPAAVIAGAQQLSLHVSMQMENASTKDTDGDWDIQEPTGLSYDISTTALVRSGETVTSAVAGKTVADLISVYENSTPVKWQIANASGTNHRTKGSVIASGSVVITQLTLNAQNKSNANYSAQCTGWGTFTVGA